MGTSKSYTPPTNSEWTVAKRAVSAYLRNRDLESLAEAINKYVKALKVAGGTTSPELAKALGGLLAFANGIANNGLNPTLEQFGRKDLIGKSPEEIFDALFEQFTGGGATLEDSLVADTFYQAFENLGISEVDDIGKIGVDQILNEIFAEFIINKFDLCFDERIGRGRSIQEKMEILSDIHNYIANTLHNKMGSYANVVFNTSDQ